MGTIENWLCTDFITSDPFCSVDSLSEHLRRKQYIVLCDESNPCYGVLTPNDVLLRPHKLAIDCLVKKDVIQWDYTYQEIRKRFLSSVSEALPVYDGDRFLGILEKSNTLNRMKELMDELLLSSEAFPKLKTSLLHNLSHEIRTPLNHVLGFMNILSEMSQVESGLNIQKYQHIVQNGSKRFLRFMNDLIDLSICESEDKLELNQSSFSAMELFRAIVEQIHADEIGDNYEVDWTYDIDALLVIYSDLNRLKQVFGHLISLFVQFPSKQCKIVLGAQHDTKNQKQLLYVMCDSNAMEEQCYEQMAPLFQAKELNQGSSFDFRIDFIQKVLQRIGGSYSFEKNAKGKVLFRIFLPIQTTEDSCLN
jgi:K+-sensing histidine kinase KdpD